MPRKKETVLAKAEKAFQVAIGDYAADSLLTAFAGLQMAMKTEVKQSKVSPVVSLAKLSGFAVSAAEAAANNGDDATASTFQARGQAFDAARQLLEAADPSVEAPTDTTQKNVGQPKSLVG